MTRSKEELMFMSRTMRLVAIFLMATLAPSSFGQEKGEPSRLTVERIFSSGEFEPEHLSIRWLADSSGLRHARAVERSLGRTRPRIATIRRPAQRASSFRRRT